MLFTERVLLELALVGLPNQRHLFHETTRPRPLQRRHLTLCYYRPSRWAAIPRASHRRSGAPLDLLRRTRRVAELARDWIVSMRSFWCSRCVSELMAPTLLSSSTRKRKRVLLVWLLHIRRRLFFRGTRVLVEILWNIQRLSRLKAMGQRRRVRGTASTTAAWSTHQWAMLPGPNL